MSLRRELTDFSTRYTYGGDEFIFVEMDEGMSLETNLRVQQIATAIEERSPEGIIDVCPANISYLVRFDPDVVAGQDLMDLFKQIEHEQLARSIDPFETRIIDVPVLFNDPWTYETLMKFRDRVQDPSCTDIEYLTKINGLPSIDAFIEAVTSTPSICSMTGFLPGVVWSYQMVTRDRQLQGPKYLRPRTETPGRAFALGGAYPAIYPVPSAGGYPIVGRVAAPVYEPAQRNPDFRDNPALVRLGDLYNYRSIDRAEYDQIQREVDSGTFKYLQRPVEFAPEGFFAAPEDYCKNLVEVLYR